MEKKFSLQQKLSKLNPELDFNGKRCTMPTLCGNLTSIRLVVEKIFI